MSRPPTQLLVYRFGPDASFEGHLVGALERIENGGTLRVLEAMFVRKDADTGELAAVDLRGRGIGGFVTPLLRFRLEPAAQRRSTQKALDSEAGETVQELARSLEPGAAIAAVLVEHVWARAVDDAVARTEGSEVANDFVDATALDRQVLERVVSPG